MRRKRGCLVGVLPLCLYIEIHDIFGFLALQKRKYDVNLDSQLISTTCNTTRQCTRDELNISKNRLTKMLGDFFYKDSAQQLLKVFKHYGNVLNKCTLTKQKSTGISLKITSQRRTDARGG